MSSFLVVVVFSTTFYRLYTGGRRAQWTPFIILIPICHDLKFKMSEYKIVAVHPLSSILAEKTTSNKW